MPSLDDAFRAAVVAGEPEAPEPAPELVDLFGAQALSRHLDFAARTLQASGEGFYTIASAGHESNAAVALALRPTDPALLHYRSGAFYCARAAQVGVDPVPDVLLGLMAGADDPISGGRHKVFGHPALHIVPQTSTIASHLPRAFGLAFALGRGRRLGLGSPWPDDAVVVTSFGDASANHSTAVGALNAIGHTVHQGLDVPLLLVCEDNGWGISVPTPPGWLEDALATRPGIDYRYVDGADPAAVLAAAHAAADDVRARRRPVLLHLRTVRLFAHAGSDAELAYRKPRDLAADRERDPLLGTARVLMAGGWTAGQVLQRYDAARDRVDETVERLLPVRRLHTAAEVMRPLTQRTRSGAISAAAGRASYFPDGLPEEAGELTLAQALNAALTDVLATCEQAIAFGEDVGVKGGVYGVTRGLQKRFGSARVFDTLLDEQTILGGALGSALAGLLPIPEIQYLAYLHNAEDQLRGEAATLRFFSDGHYANGMVVRVPGLAYQKGFGGHFHNDNSVAVLRDIPGILVACPSSAAEAPGLLRTLAGLAVGEGRVGVLLEPIALYHSRAHTAPYDAVGAWTDERDRGRLHGGGGEVLVVTFGNGVAMSLAAAGQVDAAVSVFDLRWLAPLPVEHLLEVAAAFPRVVVADETRASGGVSEGVLAALVDGGYAGRVSRVTSLDSLIPLGPAASTVLLSEADIVAGLCAALSSGHEPPH